MRNAAGFSLTSVLVAIGMLGIMASIFSSMMVYQGRETYTMGQKMKLLDFEMELKTVLAQDGYCHCLFRGLHIKVERDSLLLDEELRRLPEFFEEPMPTFPQKCKASREDLVRLDGPVRGADAKVTAIQLADLRFAGGQTYRGRLQVAFELQNSPRGFQPATTAISVVTARQETSLGRKQILGCASAGRGDPWGDMERLFNQRLSELQKPGATTNQPDHQGVSSAVLQQMLKQLQGALQQ